MIKESGVSNTSDSGRQKVYDIKSAGYFSIPKLLYDKKQFPEKENTIIIFLFNQHAIKNTK